MDVGQLRWALRQSRARRDEPLLIAGPGGLYAVVAVCRTRDGLLYADIERLDGGLTKRTKRLTSPRRRDT
jgi:hypothetical protein